MVNSVSERHAALTADGVNYRIKDKVILSDTFIHVPQGCITVLLGPNGAGKSTLLSILQGLTRPDSGEISLLDEDPLHGSAALRSRVGVMLQDGGLPQAANPLRLLHHVAGFYRKPADVTQLIKMLGIDEFQKTTIRHLSGGQKQRVSLAAALVGNPEFIFMDEPSAGLDPQSRQQIFEFVLSLRDAGMTILLTTHLLSEAEGLADYVYLLNQGRTVAHGTVAELTQRNNGGQPAAQPLLLKPSSPLTEIQILALQDSISSCKVHTEVAPVSNPSYIIEGCTGAKDLSLLTEVMASTGIHPIELHFRPRTLQDVFFEVANDQQKVMH